MDSLGWSFISTLSTMKPGLTYVVSSGLVQTSDPVRSFSMPATPLTRPELSVALLFGYLPIVLAADGTVTATIANNNASPIQPNGSFNFFVEMRDGTLSVYSHGGTAGIQMGVTGFIFGFL